MKNSNVRLIVAVLAIMMIAVSFTSCGTLKGKYIRYDNIATEDSEYGSRAEEYEAYEFFIFGNKVNFIYMLDDFKVKSKYKIDGDKLYITYFPGSENEETIEKSYSKDGKVIFIDGVPYVKE